MGRKPKGERIAQDALAIEKRLANGERAGPIAKEYGVSHTCLKMNLEAAIGKAHWRLIVRQGRYLSVKPPKENALSACDQEIQQRIAEQRSSTYCGVYFECSHCGHESNREGPCTRCLTGWVKKAERIQV